MAYPTFLTCATTLCLTIVLKLVHADTQGCAEGSMSDGHTCQAEVPQASLADSLLQKKFHREAAGLKVQQVVCDGITSVGKCWYLSAVGQNCQTTCAARGLLYSFAAPKHDMVPLLLGHSPSTKHDPWLHVECYMPSEDSYHPYNPQAWGVPGATPSEELWRGGQYTYELCQLACPCGFEYNNPPVAPPVATTLPPFPVTQAPISYSSCTGLEVYGRCWYLSDRGASCDDTCLAHDCSYSYASPAEEMVPKLVGHMPSGRDEPWAHLECYISKEDRYHPAVTDPTFGSATPTDLAQAGQYSHEACRLSCPCIGQCTGYVSTPAPFVYTTPVPRAVQSCRGLVADGACWYLSDIGDNCDQTCAAQGSIYSFAAPSQDIIPQLIGREPSTKNSPWLFLECYVPSEDRYHPYNKNAWGVPAKTPPEELAEAGQHDYPTCQLACPCQLPMVVDPTLPPAPPVVYATLPPAPPVVFATPPPTPPIIVLPPTPTPTFYVPPTLPPSPTFYVPPTLPPTLPPRPVVVPTPTPAPIYYPAPTPPIYYPAPTPAPIPTNGREWTHISNRGTDGGVGYVTGNTATPTLGPVNPSRGFKAVGRTWFMSGLGESCASTCARQGLSYSWAEPPKDNPITPRLIGQVPVSKQWPWAFLECYVAAEDRYHTVNPKSWGVPQLTPQADLSKAAQWSDDGCQLACPCTAKPTECSWVQPPACSPEFEYKGKMYTGCPTVDHDEPWCGHHHLHNGKDNFQYEWSRCINTCETTAVSNSRCSWKQGPYCVDEFDFQGMHYVGCTSVNHDTPWCSNTDPYTGSWSHCQYDCDAPTAEDQQAIDQIRKDVLNDDTLCSWKPVTACAATFSYKGFDYEGCAWYVDHPTPWCSHDRVHGGKWSECEQFCTKASDAVPTPR